MKGRGMGRRRLFFFRDGREFYDRQKKSRIDRINFRIGYRIGGLLISLDDGNKRRASLSKRSPARGGPANASQEEADIKFLHRPKPYYTGCWGGPNTNDTADEMTSQPMPTIDANRCQSAFGMAKLACDRFFCDRLLPRSSAKSHQ